MPVRVDGEAQHLARDREVGSVSFQTGNDTATPGAETLLPVVGEDMGSVGPSGIVGDPVRTASVG